MIHYLRLTPTSHYLNTEKSECPLGCPFLIQPRGFSHTVAEQSESQAMQRGGTKCCAGSPVQSESPTSPLSLTGKLLVITSAAEPACLQKKATPRFVLQSTVKKLTVQSRSQGRAPQNPDLPQALKQPPTTSLMAGAITARLK